MPTYEYACPVCNHEFETKQSIKEQPLLECPQCRVCALKRMINSNGGFILKGGGWYKDSYDKPPPNKQ